MSGESTARGLIDTDIVILLGALDPDELPEENDFAGLTELVDVRHVRRP
ncbi:hypothetical protein ABZ738_21260 [Micromonospora sp. NPDC047793]|nr:hypothetical protein [Verrucosispora sp. SN26_14.1]